MRARRSLNMTLATLVTCCLAPPPASADTVPSEITMRGETRPVWPLSDLRARGYDVEPIPREDNAAWIYIEAINAYAEKPDDLRDEYDYALAHRWPDKPHDAGLKEWITSAENRRALELARKASKFERCQFPYFGDPRGSIIQVLLPSLSHYRHLAKMLAVDGRRLEAAGKHAQAFENYLVISRMGHHVAQGITLIEPLVGIACSALADDAMRNLALRHDLPEADLETMLHSIQEVANLRPDVRRGVRMEKNFGHAIVDEFTKHPGGFFRNLRALGGSYDFSPAAGSAESGWGALEARIGQLMFPDQSIKRHMDYYYDELIRRAGLPAHEANWQGGWDEQLLQAVPQWDVMARMLLPSLGRANEMAERLRTQMQMTQVVTALRLAAARRDGRFPERLDQVTDLLDEPETAIDPFSGEQFVYRPDAKGWLMYSFSDNLTDDGGEEGDRRWKPDYVVRYPPEDPKPFED